MTRYHTAGLAWLTGVSIYVGAAVYDGYDGFPSLCIIPALGSVVSALFVGASVVLGAVLRQAALLRTPCIPVIAASAGLGIWCFGSTAGWTEEFTHPETGRPDVGLHPAAAICGYFLLLFGVANWPLMPPESDSVNGSFPPRRQQ